MKIAFTKTEGKGNLDRLLADFADHLQGRGVRACGIVQINSECAPTHRCDMDVRVLPDGPTIRISQFLGHESRGCRLNPGALETAVAEVERQMERPFDVFILNKFGKQEADGRGFRNLIGQALAQGAAVIAGVNGLNQQRFEEFSEGTAAYVEPDQEALMAWFNAPQDT